MQTKQIVVALSLVLVTALMLGQSASAQPVICDKWCEMKTSADLAKQNLDAQHGKQYFHLFANYGWHFLSHSHFGGV